VAKLHPKIVEIYFPPYCSLLTEVAISKGMAALTSIRSSVVLPKMIQVMNGLIWIKLLPLASKKK
jgi:hypothetical protein